MNPIIIGNICSLLAMFTDSVSANRKTARGVLLVQSLSQLIYFIGTVALKGYSGAVQNAVSILRNFVAIKGIRSPVVEWFLVFLGVALGLGLNNLGFIGLLPVAANLQYTLVIFRFRDNERMLKFSFLLCMLCFALFNIAIFNVVGTLTNLAVAVSTAIYLIRTRKG